MLPEVPTAQLPTQLMESTYNHNITLSPKQRRQTVKAAASAKGQQRLQF